jgi:hypothetical protein
MFLKFVTLLMLQRLLMNLPNLMFLKYLKFVTLLKYQHFLMLLQYH